MFSLSLCSTHYIFTLITEGNLFFQENVDGVLPTYNSLLMYYDGSKQWDAVYKTSLVSSTSCSMQLVN